MNGNPAVSKAPDTDIAWTGGQPKPVSAAKLHLLNLDPIRDRLGARWPRLSALVHKLFENALREAQGPNDRFLSTGELSYLVTFENLSQEAATLACASIAKKVCELLFGADDGEMLVRSLVGTVQGPIHELTLPVAEKLSGLLEQVGTETITSSSAAARPEPLGDLSFPPLGGWLSSATMRAKRFGLVPAFLPIWDLQRDISQSMSTVYLGRDGAVAANLAWLLRGANPAELADLEIAMLMASADYVQQFERAGQICAMTATVSYQTLSHPSLRVRYLDTLKRFRQSGSCPLLIRVEYIPAGIVPGRLAELVAMLAATQARVVLHFDDLLGLPRPGFRLGITGLGADLPASCPDDRLARLFGEAREQRAFSFLTGITNGLLAARAKASGVRFASGLGLDKAIFAGSEDLPKLPLQTASCALRSAS